MSIYSERRIDMIFPNVRAEMSRKDMTMLNLSEVTGIPYSTLIPQLNGQRALPLKNAKKIKDAIDVNMSLDVLFEEG